MTSSLSSLLMKLASSLLMNEFLASVWSLRDNYLSAFVGKLKNNDDTHPSIKRFLVVIHYTPFLQKVYRFFTTISAQAYQFSYVVSIKFMEGAVIITAVASQICCCTTLQKSKCSIMQFYSAVNSVQSDANYSKCSRGMLFLCPSSSLCTSYTSQGSAAADFTACIF